MDSVNSHGSFHLFVFKLLGPGLDLILDLCHGHSRRYPGGAFYSEMLQHYKWQTLKYGKFFYQIYLLMVCKLSHFQTHFLRL